MIETVLMLAAFIAVFWFAAEVFSRLWLSRFGKYYSWTPHSRIRLTLLEDVFPKLDRETRFFVNSLGERGGEPPASKESAWHVVALGGSAVECYMNDQETQWPHRIQVELNQTEALRDLDTGRVHVGNIGRSLMACGPLCTMASKVLDNYDHIDQVVMMVGSSDIVAWTEMGAPAEYTPKIPDNHGIYRLHPLGPFTWHPIRSASRRLATAIWRALRKPGKNYSNVGNTVRRNREAREKGIFVQTLPDPTPMLELYRTNLRRLIEIAKTKSDRVMVVRTPWLDRELSNEEERWFWNLALGKPNEDGVRTYLSYDIARELLEQMDRATSEVASEMGVDQVNIRPHLDNDFDTWYDEFHLTPKGCEQMGSAVAAAIRLAANGQAEGDSSPESAKRSASLRAQA